MRVAADRRDPLYPEVKLLNREPSRLKEGHNEATQATVNVQPDVVLLGKFSELYDIILASIWKINC
jgi:hypothetical protein